MPVPSAYLWIASLTCIASSRVGTSTRPPVGAAAAASCPRAAVALRECRRPVAQRSARSPCDASACWSRLGQALDHRQGEGRGLAGAGGGLGEQVAAAEHDGDRLPLDRRRFLVAERRHGGRAECRRARVSGSPPSMRTCVRKASHHCPTALSGRRQRGASNARRYDRHHGRLAPRAHLRGSAAALLLACGHRRRFASRAWSRSTGRWRPCLDSSRRRSSARKAPRSSPAMSCPKGSTDRAGVRRSPVRPLHRAR